MRTQAKRCTNKELAYLAHWRRNGYALTVDDAIPLSTLTPPVKPVRFPLAEVCVGSTIIFAACGLGVYWLAKGAGII